MKRHQYDPFTETRGPLRVLIRDRCGLVSQEWPLPEGTDMRAEIERLARKYKAEEWTVEKEEPWQWRYPWFYMRKEGERVEVSIVPLHQTPMAPAGKPQW